MTKLDSGAVKHDQNKLEWGLLPPDALESTIQVLMFGAQKYDAHNWSKGMLWSRLFNALMRHMWAWWRGERLDPESGLPHLAHAMCCLLFLLSHELRGIGTDDRPPPLTEEGNTPSEPTHSE